MTSRIQHSHVWKGRFQANVRKQRGNPTATRYIRSLSLAKHRFDSSSKPFSRTVVFFEAYLLTVQQMADERKSAPEGKEAAAFLASLDEEQCIALGNLADAGQECLALVRFLDNEEFDKSALASELHRFLARVDVLFSKRECVTMKSSYTRAMLNFLQRPRQLFYKNSVKVLGGPGKVSADLLDRCMARMANWTRLAKCVLRAEFPNFELLQAFGILCLHGSKTLRHADENAQERDAEQEEYLSRFCNLLGLDKDELVCEMEDHKPIAQRLYATGGGMTTMGAWASAVAMTQRDARSRRGHPVAALREVLARFGAYGGSTSGVERLFASSHRAAGAFRADLSESLINDELQLLCDVDPKGDEELVRGARTVWIQVYGAARDTRNRATRLDANKKRACTKIRGKLKLAGWVKRRREEVDGLVASKRPRVSLKADSAGEIVGRNLWSEKHQKEEHFQDSKRLTRFMEVLDQGYALATEDTPGAQEALKLWRDHEHQVATDYFKGKAKLHALRCAKDTDVASQKLFVTPGANVGDEQEFKRALGKQGLQRTHDRLAADLFLVPSIEAPGQRNLWCAILSGGMLCTLKYLMSSGHAGASLALKPAITSKRQVWCSADFVTKHPEVHNILCAKVRSPASRWKWITSKEELLRQGGKRSAAGHGGEVVAFVTAREQTSLAPQPVANLLHRRRRRWRGLKPRHPSCHIHATSMHAYFIAQFVVWRCVCAMQSSGISAD